MRRRDALLAASALVSANPGCLARLGDRTRTVPLRVVNDSSRRARPTITVTERVSKETPFARAVALGPGDDRTFHVGPIDPQRDYVVSYEMGEQGSGERVSGDEIRAIELTIGERGRAGMLISASDGSPSAGG